MRVKLRIAHSDDTSACLRKSYRGPVIEWLTAAKGALSENTERALRSDFSVYITWCLKQDKVPWPADPDMLAQFIADMSLGKATATVRRHIYSISALHRGMGWGNPLEHMTVKMALKRMARQLGSRQTQAQGLTWPLRQKLLEASGDRVIDLRNRALLAVAYDTMLRRSELVSLQASDFLVDCNGSATILLRGGKTDPEGYGAVLYVAPDTVEMVLAWLEKGQIEEGPLFRSVRSNGRVGGRLDASQIPRIYKKMATKAGLGGDLVAGLSGHSTRVGAAQDMIASGIELPAILQAGRWKSTCMVSRYGEHLLAHRSGAALLARLQRRDKRPMPKEIPAK